MKNATSTFVVKWRWGVNPKHPFPWTDTSIMNPKEKFFSILSGPGRVWDPDPNQDFNDWTAKGVHTKCSTSKMRISPSTQEMALRHSGKKHHFSLSKNLFYLNLYAGGKSCKFYIHWVVLLVMGPTECPEREHVSDCPSHGSSEFSPDQSSLQPGMFLCFGHRETPNTLKKYANGSTIAVMRQQEPGKPLLIPTSHFLTHAQLVSLCCFRGFLLDLDTTVKPGCISFWALLSSWLVSSWCCRKRTENGWGWGKASII